MKKGLSEADVPIVLVPGGTLDDPLQEYGMLEEGVQKSFPGHAVHWAYSSPHILKRIKPAGEREKLTLAYVLKQLHENGVKRILAQSLQIICGAEFHRLPAILSRTPLKWNVGLPLLSHDRDFEDILKLIVRLRSVHEESDYLVLAAHGSYHPAWTAYATLDAMIRERFGNRVCLGTLSHVPGKEPMLAALRDSGAQSVHLIPFLFSVGSHVRRDIVQGPASWKRQLEKSGYKVSATPHGLSRYPEVIDIFIRHIGEAMEQGGDAPV